MTEEGKPYGPVRYKQIVNEIFYITQHTSTPYGDVLKMTPIERNYLIGFLIEHFKEQKRQQDLISKGNKTPQ